jgi:HlyD family secretion protein
MKRVVIAVVLVIAVLAVGAWGYVTYLAPQPEPAVPEEPENEVTRVVSATGVVLPFRWAALSFKMAGQVQEVLVQEGDQAQEAQILVQLDSSDLEDAVAQAEAALAAAQATLAQVQAGPRPQEVGAAQAGLAGAEAQLAMLKAGATQEQITAARGAMETARFALQQAQAAYDEVSWLNNRMELPQALALQQATAEYEIASANYQALLRGPSAEEIAAAQAEVDRARASLELLEAGATPEQVAVAQAQVTQAELAVSQAHSALDDSSLRAPFAGTLGALRVREGEMVTLGAPVLTLGDVSNFKIETTDLNEIDLYLVRVGQKVDLTFDALPGRSIRGTVTRIAPMANMEQGGTNYTVTIELDEQDPELRWGMTAFVDIVGAVD